MEEKGLRYNQEKLRWSLVHFESLESLVKVLDFGSKKYDDHNWMRGMPITEVLESLLRHAFAYLGGEDDDPESGESHLGHIMCNTMFLEYISKHKPEFDDRLKPGK